MSPVLDPALVERFRDDCLALLGTDTGAPASGRAGVGREAPASAGSNHPSPARPLALAVSGGPDSMALLALAAAAFPGAVIAATVDHRLRAASAGEAALVAAHCAAIAVRHAVLVPEAPLTGASIQAVARTARYRLLADWAAEATAVALATAHHRDDQAETFLMRAVRGSGPGGLGGIRPSAILTPEGGPSPVVLRPLLRWRRGELRALAEALALPFVDDPSNHDPRFDRTRARRLLADTPWLDATQLAAAADHCREADTALASVAGWLWDERVRAEPPDCRIDLAGLPRELTRRLAREAIGRVRLFTGMSAPAFDVYAANIERLLDAVEAGTAATHAGVLVSQTEGIWRFRAAPPRRSL